MFIFSLKVTSKLFVALALISVFLTFGVGTASAHATKASSQKAITCNTSIAFILYDNSNEQGDAVCVGYYGSGTLINLAQSRLRSVYISFNDKTSLIVNRGCGLQLYKDINAVGYITTIPAGNGPEHPYVFYFPKAYNDTLSSIIVC